MLSKAGVIIIYGRLTVQFLAYLLVFQLLFITFRIGARALGQKERRKIGAERVLVCYLSNVKCLGVKPEA